MDVTLPNGVIIQGVPEDATKEQIMQKAISSGLATAEDFSQEMPEGGFWESVSEPAKAIGLQLGASVAGGLKGLAQTAFGDAEGGAQSIREMQQAAAEAGAPQTQAGQQGLQTVNDFVQAGIDIARFPISGLMGLGAIASGQGVDAAAQVVNEVKQNGVSETAGNIVFEQTDSPLLSTIAYMTPEIAASVIPATKVMKQRSAFQTALATKMRNAQADPQTSQALLQISNYMKNKGFDPSIQSALNNIRNNASDQVKAQIDDLVEDARIGVEPETIARNAEQIAQTAGKSTATKDLAFYILNGSKKVKNDPLAKEAVDKGFDQGVIASVGSATPQDRLKMLEMVNTMERIKGEALFGVRNRPSDIAGNSLLERVNYVKQVNQEAGDQLEIVANGLKGQNVEFQPAIDAFLTRLDNIGVSVDSNLKPVFKGSRIEKVNAAENVIKNIFERMTGSGTPDAYDVHSLKQYIDEQVTYGKAAEGLTGRTEGILKSLRRDLDSVLDSNFDDYNQVNTTYSETISALDALQGVAGQKMDLFGKNADKAVGTLLRRMMSNAQSRINLTDAVDDLERVSAKYGANFQDDVAVQMLFADELDSVFGATARTGFQANVSEGVKAGVAEVATGSKSGAGMVRDAISSLMKKKPEQNQEEIFEAIRKYLERSQ